MRAKKICKVRDCPEISEAQGLCGPHLREHQAKVESRRTRSNKHYQTSAWKTKRARYLRVNPWCVVCQEEADTVDHIISLHEGGSDEPENFQSLCRSCHSRKTAKFDGGFGNPRA